MSPFLANHKNLWWLVPVLLLAMVAGFLSLTNQGYLASLTNQVLLADTILPALTNQTYYIDFDGGNDTNNGLSTTAAWKHAPGDVNATGVPKLLKPQPGDTLKFKGGVTYRGGFTIQGSSGVNGTVGNPITYKGDGWGGQKAILDGRTAGLKTMKDDLGLAPDLVLSAETARAITQNPGQKTVIVGPKGFSDLIGIATGIEKTLKDDDGGNK